MSSDLPQQSVPIIIKGGDLDTSSPIEISTMSYFQITQEFQSQPNEWLQSSSDFELSYVESLNLISPSGDDQFCQTWTMSHPLTYAFKDAKNKNIFVISEVAQDKNYTLNIDVQYANSYFQIDQQSSENASNGSDWTDSVFVSETPVEVAKIEVTDSSGTPVCQFLRSNEEQISLSVEPPV